MPTVEALFPVHVAVGAAGYDRIATVTSDDCLTNDAIPEQLADRIQTLGGCIGARFALYVDSAQEALITVGAIAMADPTAAIELMPDGDPSDTIGMLPIPAGSTLRPRPGAPTILGDATTSLDRIVIGVGTPTVGVEPDYGRLSGQIRELTAKIRLGFLTIPGSAAPTATG